jgi:hypothetical protein
VSACITLVSDREWRVRDALVETMERVGGNIERLPGVPLKVSDPRYS